MQCSQTMRRIPSTLSAILFYDIVFVRTGSTDRAHRCNNGVLPQSSFPCKAAGSSSQHCVITKDSGVQRMFRLTSPDMWLWKEYVVSLAVCD